MALERSEHSLQTVHSLAAGAGAVGGKDLPKGASMVTNDFGFKGFVRCMSSTKFKNLITTKLQYMH